MIDEAAAVEIARRRAEQRSWAFAEPLQVTTRRGWRGGIRRYEIETNAGALGSKARFVIDGKTGEILSEGYVPR